MPPGNVSRIVTTCQACRRRKVRCNRSRPRCDQCIAAGLNCDYAVATQRSVTYRFVDDETSASSSQTVGHDTTTQQEIPISRDRIVAIEQRLEQLQALVATLTQQRPGQRPDLHIPRIEPPSTYTDTTAGVLSQQGDGRVHYVSPMYWATLCKESADLDNIISSLSLSADQGNSETSEDEETLLSTHVPRNFGLGTMSSRHMPSRQLCDRLLEAYFFNCHPLTPLVHVPSFRARYEAYWTLSEAARRIAQGKLNFEALLLSLVYAGAASISEQHEFQNVASRCHRLALSIVHAAGFPTRPTLDTLRAYLLCHSMPAKEEEPLASVAFIGLALRAANILGLHIDPSRFLQIDAIEAEERRRVWLHLVHVDVAIAIAAGLPPLVSSNDDIKPLSELRDELIGTPESQHYEETISLTQQPDATMISTAGILAAAKHKFTLGQRRFLHRLDRPIVDEDFPLLKKRWIELGVHLKSARQRIGMHDSVISYSNNEVLNQWAQEVMAIFLDQRYYLLCYPLLHDQDYSISQDLYFQTVISCLCFLIRCAEISSNPLYRRFCWSWPGQHQPIHALVIVLNDLQRQSPAYDINVARNAVDVIFALSGQQGGLTGGIDDNAQPLPRLLSQVGVELWGYISRLRARTWRGLNWDAKLSWDRRQAVQCLHEHLLPVIDILEGYITDDNSVIDQIGNVSRPQAQTATHLTEDLSYPSLFNWGELDLDDILVDNQATHGAADGFPSGPDE